MKTPVLLNQQAEQYRQLGILHGYLRAHHAPDDVIEALIAITRKFDDPNSKPKSEPAVAASSTRKPFEDDELESGERQTDHRWEEGFNKNAGASVGGSGDPDADENNRVERIAEGKKRRAWDALEKARCWGLYEKGSKPKAIAEKLNEEFGNGRDNVGVSAMLNTLKKGQAAA